MALIQLRPDVDAENCALEWIAYASNAFNTMVPFYANVDTTPLIWPTPPAKCPPTTSTGSAA